MNRKAPKPSLDRSARTLIKAFTFAGAILAGGAYGLLRTLILFGRELGWLESEPGLGGLHWWLLGGIGAGWLLGRVLVRLRTQ
jgi:hypothetical protein